MSQIHNRIITTYSAHGGNAVAVANQVAGGMTNIGRAAMEATRFGARWDAQMRAIGTTLRYALAGSLVFGAVRLNQTLMETQRQLALIGAIGGFDEMTGSAERADQMLNRLYDDAQRGALSAITPVGDFNNALVNLYSTVQNLKPDQAVEMTREISKGAQLAQVSAEDLTRAVAGMTQAFAMTHGVENVGRFTRGFYALTSQAPGGIAYGPQFIQQMAPLAAVSRFANIDPAQMMGLYLTTLRTGGTPATAGRGLQYLLQSISVPASDEARKALKKAGITPDVVQQKGGVPALQMLIEHARGLGLRKSDEKKIGSLSVDQLDMLEGMAPEQVGPALGISGKGLDFLSQAIGRIHGIRALITLMAQQAAPTGDQMAKDIALVREAMSDTEKAHSDFARKWQEFARRQPLRAAATSVDVVQRQIIEAFQPLANLAARGISRVGGKAIQDPETTQRVIQGGGALLAALGIAKATGLGGKYLGRVPGIGGLFGGAGRAFVATNAAEAAMTGAALGPGMSPQNPLFVIVVGQIFGGSVVGGPNAATTKAAATAESAAAGGVGGWLARARGGLTRGALRGGIPGIAAFAAASQMPGWTDMPFDPGLGGFKKDFNSGWDLFSGLFGGGGDGKGRGGKIPIEVYGRGSVILDLNVNDGKKPTKKQRVHVPVDLWSGGRTPGSQGGKANTTRGGR